MERITIVIEARDDGLGKTVLEGLAGFMAPARMQLVRATIKSITVEVHDGKRKDDDT